MSSSEGPSFVHPTLARRTLRSRSEFTRRFPARGFTYLGLLFALVLLGLALGAAGTVWSVVRQRDREQQLLWAGGEIRRAIGQYYQGGPGGLRSFPQSLQDLTEDRRGPVLVRHLRRAYRDPMTSDGDWELIRGSDGGLTGVASKAQGKPMKQQGFAEADRAFEDATCYCDWRFVFLPQLQRRPGTVDLQAAKGLTLGRSAPAPGAPPKTDSP